MLDRILKGMLILLVGGFVLLMFYVIPRDIERSDRAKEIADQMGCTVIGHARDLGSVKFLDCNGEVKLIRVK